MPCIRLLTPPPPLCLFNPASHATTLSQTVSLIFATDIFIIYLHS